MVSQTELNNVRVRQDRRELRLKELLTRRGFTLVELLVVIAIIGMLVSISIPAVFSARESARTVYCANNLRQLAIGINGYAARKNSYCSGAFNWMFDGAVTEVGWVADQVAQGSQVGSMICPSNPLRLADAFYDLLHSTPASMNVCNVNYPGTLATFPNGSPYQTQSNGALVYKSPCSEIINPSGTTTYPPDGPDRATIVALSILAQSYNTNYTASWYLVRGGMLLDANGNLAQPAASACSTGAPLSPASLQDRNSTIGPLSSAMYQGGNVPSNTIPILGCGAASPGKTLTANLGSFPAGTPLVASFTGGPLLTATMAVPTFAAGTQYGGATGYWSTWGNQSLVLQDYRQFNPVHKGTVANIAFVDGSVRSYTDANGDGQFNNGFPAGTPTNPNGFADPTLEIYPSDWYSGYSLQGP